MFLCLFHHSAVGIFVQNSALQGTVDVFITNLVDITGFELSVIDQNAGLATIVDVVEQGSVLPNTTNIAFQDESTKVGKADERES